MDMDNLTNVVKENRSAINHIVNLAKAGEPLNSSHAVLAAGMLKTQIGGKKRKSTKKRKSIKKRKSTKRRRPTKKRR